MIIRVIRVIMVIMVIMIIMIIMIIHVIRVNNVNPNSSKLPKDVYIGKKEHYASIIYTDPNGFLCR